MVVQYIDKHGEKQASTIRPGYEPTLLYRILLEKETSELYTFDPSKANPVVWQVKLSGGNLKMKGKLLNSL